MRVSQLTYKLDSITQLAYGLDVTGTLPRYYDSVSLSCGAQDDPDGYSFCPRTFTLSLQNQETQAVVDGAPYFTADQTNSQFTLKAPSNEFAGVYTATITETLENGQALTTTFTYTVTPNENVIMNAPDVEQMPTINEQDKGNAVTQSFCDGNGSSTYATIAFSESDPNQFYKVTLSEEVTIYTVFVLRSIDQFAIAYSDTLKVTFGSDSDPLANPDFGGALDSILQHGEATGSVLAVVKNDQFFMDHSLKIRSFQAFTKRAFDIERYQITLTGMTDQSEFGSKYQLQWSEYDTDLVQQTSDSHVKIEFGASISLSGYQLLGSTEQTTDCDTLTNIEVKVYNDQTEVCSSTEDASVLIAAKCDASQATHATIRRSGGTNPDELKINGIMFLGACDCSASSFDQSLFHYMFEESAGSDITYKVEDPAQTFDLPFYMDSVSLVCGDTNWSCDLQAEFSITNTVTNEVTDSAPWLTHTVSADTATIETTDFSHQGTYQIVKRTYIDGTSVEITDTVNIEIQAECARAIFMDYELPIDRVIIENAPVTFTTPIVKDSISDNIDPSSGWDFCLGRQVDLRLKEAGGQLALDAADPNQLSSLPWATATALDENQVTYTLNPTHKEIGDLSLFGYTYLQNTSVEQYKPFTLAIRSICFYTALLPFQVASYSYSQNEQAEIEVPFPGLDPESSQEVIDFLQLNSELPCTAYVIELTEPLAEIEVVDNTLVVDTSKPGLYNLRVKLSLATEPTVEMFSNQFSVQVVSNIEMLYLTVQANQTTEYTIPTFDGLTDVQLVTTVPFNYTLKGRTFVFTPMVPETYNLIWEVTVFGKPVELPMTMTVTEPTVIVVETQVLEAAPLEDESSVDEEEEQEQEENCELINDEMLCESETDTCDTSGCIKKICLIKDQALVCEEEPCLMGEDDTCTPLSELLDEGSGWDGWKVLEDKFKDEETEEREGFDIAPRPKLEITPVRNDGTFSLIFSEPMDFSSLKGRRLSGLTEKHIAISMAVQSEYPDKVGFTWATTSIESQQIDIQIAFANPLYVSSGSYDQITVRLLPASILIFRSEEGQILQNPMIEFTAAVPKQKSDELISLKQGQKAGMKQTGSTIMIARFVLKFIMAGSMQMLYTVVNALQVQGTFGLLQLQLPANVYEQLVVLNSMSGFDVVNPDIIIDYLMDFSEVDPVAENWVEMDMESRSLIHFMGTFGFIFAYNILQLVIWLLLQALSPISLYIALMARRLRRQLFFELLGTLILEGYIEITLGAIVNAESLKWTTPYDYVNSLLTLILLPIMVASPVVVYFVLRRKKDILALHITKQRYGVFYDGLKVGREDQREIIPFFTPWFLLRRLMLVMNMYYMRTVFLWAQMSISIWLVLIDVVLKIHLDPYEDRVSAFMEKLNDAFVLITAYLLFLQTDFVGTLEVKAMYGNCFNTTILVMLALNGLVLGLKVVFDIRQTFFKWRYERHMNKLRPKQKRSCSEIIKDRLIDENEAKEIQELTVYRMQEKKKQELNVQVVRGANAPPESKWIHANNRAEFSSKLMRDQKEQRREEIRKEIQELKDFLVDLPSVESYVELESVETERKQDGSEMELSKPIPWHKASKVCERTNTVLLPVPPKFQDNVPYEKSVFQKSRHLLVPLHEFEHHQLKTQRDRRLKQLRTADALLN